MITGASTGIGTACALSCARHGMTVFAGVRNLDAADMLRRNGGDAIIPLELDVTDVNSVHLAADRVCAMVGKQGLNGLINNAGCAVSGPLEVLPLAALRQQFEVNVIGHIAVTQAFLPLLRAARGRIVNMGSISGQVTIPLLGPYCASKYALEALTDALRLELQPWGIMVAIIEPGAIATPIWDKSLRAAEELAASVGPDVLKPYEKAIEAMKQVVVQTVKRAVPAETVARAVLHALTASRPKTRYVVGWDARIQAMMASWLPDRLLDRLLTGFLKFPRESSQSIQLPS